MGPILTKAELIDYLTLNWSECVHNLAVIEKSLLFHAKYSSLSEFIGDLPFKFGVISILGGENSRWKKSFSDSASEEIRSEFNISNIDTPKFLANVPNIINGINQTHIPIITYNFHAFNALFQSDNLKHLILCGQKDYQSEIEDALRLVSDHNVIHFKQTIYPNRDSLSGHGDALYQCRDLITDLDYVIVHFGGGVISSKSLHLSLLALHVLQMWDEYVGLLMPSAKIENSIYPIFVDNLGLPRAFGHERLWGKKSLVSNHLSTSGCDVGIYIFCVSQLQRIFNDHASDFYKLETHSVDHIAEKMATKGLVRQFCISQRQEAYCVKSIFDLPEFLYNHQAILYA